MRMHPLLMGGSSGLPRNGLVGLWDPYRDVYGRNVLPVGAEDFTAAHGWSAFGGATITVTPGQPDPDGGNNAYRVQSSGGSSSVKYILQSMGNSNPHTVYVGLWMKVLSGSAILSVSGAAASKRSGTSEWSRLLTNYTAPSDVDSLYLQAPETANELDILVYQPVRHPSTWIPYSAPAGAPVTLQTGADYSGNGNTLTLGATTNASTDDPAFTGVSMLHAADYACSGNLTGITLAGDWTLPIICKTAGTANTLVSLASAAAADQYQAIEYNGSTKVRIKTVNGATVTTSDDLTVSATAVQMLVLTSSGDTLTLKRMDTGTSVTATNADPTGAGRLCIGGLGVNTVASLADALEWHLLPLYRRAWTAGEATKAYVYAKSLMARRGVTLA